MPEIPESLVDLLYRAARGGVASTTLLGPFFDQVLFGVVDDLEDAEKHAELRAELDEIAPFAYPFAYTYSEQGAGKPC